MATTVCVGKINDINVVVCVLKPIQHSLQPSVYLITGFGGYEGGRKKDGKIVPIPHCPNQNTPQEQV